MSARSRLAAVLDDPELAADCRRLRYAALFFVVNVGIVGGRLAIGFYY